MINGLYTYVFVGIAKMKIIERRDVSLKKKKYIKVMAAIIVISVVIMFGAVFKDNVLAAENREVFVPKSYGRFVYDDGNASNNNGYEHDILLDAADFTNIAQNINGLADITDELTQTAFKKSDVIDTLDGVIENTDQNKAAGANALKELAQAFRDGVNKIYNKLDGLGFTPKTNSPDDINESIQDMYDSRYREGYADGAAQVQNNAKITYTYHQHSGSSTSGGGCYNVSKRVTVYVRCDGQEKAGDPYFNRTVLISSLIDGRSEGTCTICGRSGGTNGGASVGDSIKCDYASEEYSTIYDIGCGKSTNTITGVVISFDSED